MFPDTPGRDHNRQACPAPDMERRKADHPPPITPSRHSRRWATRLPRRLLRRVDQEIGVSKWLLLKIGLRPGSRAESWPPPTYKRCAKNKANGGDATRTVVSN